MIKLIPPREVFEEMIESQFKYKNETFAIYTGRMPRSSLIQFFTFDHMENQNFTDQVFSSEMVYLKEDLRTHFEAFYVQSESCIYEMLNEFILQCHQHGFIEYLVSKHFNWPKKSKRDPRKVLTLYMLSAGFYIWLISISVAFVVFIIEHVVRYFSRTRKLPPKREVEVIYDTDDEEDSDSD